MNQDKSNNKLQRCVSFETRILKQITKSFIHLVKKSCNRQTFAIEVSENYYWNTHLHKKFVTLKQYLYTQKSKL